MRACAAPRPAEDMTWIDERMIDAYMGLHQLGHAHSLEAWLDDQLVGGLYGVRIGGAFFGESMFMRADLGGTNSSKICLVHLVGWMRRRRMTLATLDDHGQDKDRDWFEGLGLWLLRLTVGYGLGRRYFRVLWWVGGFSLLGMVLLINFGEHSLPNWPSLFFASLDQLLPIVRLDKAHDALIFGGPTAEPQADWLRYIFYLYKVIGWGLGSFIIAGLAGLTQRN